MWTLVLSYCTFMTVLPVQPKVQPALSDVYCDGSSLPISLWKKARTLFVNSLLTWFMKTRIIRSNLFVVPVEEQNIQDTLNHALAEVATEEVSCLKGLCVAPSSIRISSSSDQLYYLGKQTPSFPVARYSSCPQGVCAVHWEPCTDGVEKNEHMLPPKSFQRWSSSPAHLLGVECSSLGLSGSKENGRSRSFLP